MKDEHDSLHIETSGLSRCHCMCRRCWLHLGLTEHGRRVGKPKGRCICRFCPCEKTTLISWVPGNFSRAR